MLIIFRMETQSITSFTHAMKKNHYTSQFKHSMFTIHQIDLQTNKLFIIPACYFGKRESIAWCCYIFIVHGQWNGRTIKKTTYQCSIMIKRTLPKLQEKRYNVHGCIFPICMSWMCLCEWCTYNPLKSFFFVFLLLFQFAIKPPCMEFFHVLKLREIMFTCTVTWASYQNYITFHVLYPSLRAPLQVGSNSRRRNHLHFRISEQKKYCSTSSNAILTEVERREVEGRKGYPE